MELVKIAGPLILAFIMLSLGLGLKIENFKRVLIQPKDFLIGFISQVIFFPLAITISSSKFLTSREVFPFKTVDNFSIN